MHKVPAAHKSGCLKHATFSTGVRPSDRKPEPIPDNIPNFDAVRFVSLLEKEGFSKNQSMAVMSALDDVVEERYEYHRAPTKVHALLTLEIHSASTIKYSLISKADQEVVSNYIRQQMHLRRPSDT
jgi:hypothetical protein